MKLSEKRTLFTKLLAELILWADSQGLKLALDEVKRSESQAKANAAAGTGIANSLHIIGLAADLQLYIDDPTTEGFDYNWQSHSEAHRKIGEKWKTMHPLARWGGDFKKQDGNHYSLEHNGVK